MTIALRMPCQTLSSMIVETSGTIYSDAAELARAPHLLMYYPSENVVDGLPDVTKFGPSHFGWMTTTGADEAPSPPPPVPPSLPPSHSPIALTFTYLYKRQQKVRVDGILRRWIQFIREKG